MPTEVENVCCRETPPVARRIGETTPPIQCMTLHPGLEPVCLNIYSLQNSMNVYRADYGPLRVRGYEKRCRHLAYRTFVSWCCCYLGRKVRVVFLTTQDNLAAQFEHSPLEEAENAQIVMPDYQGLEHSATPPHMAGCWAPRHRKAMLSC
ncbi:hypothetical protein Q7C36_004155 [Tachysurus vachellii]|uniref:Uncharacterized protein n=1 Tax=Tachysurus vachellii TaxID=175792 RepID=A0AA88NJQ5_TACVA|nr:hypothetical protein Q7C36_004155 [Tachysurus vachellii]